MHVNSCVFIYIYIFLMKILQECKDIRIAKANKKYTQLINQQKTNYINSGIITLRYTKKDSAVKA